MKTRKKRANPPEVSAAPATPPDTTGEENTFLSHLVELRARLLRSVVIICLIFFGLAVFARDLYQLFAYPLLGQYSGEQLMIATGVTAPLFIPIKVTFFFSILLCIPYILHQIWSFIAPGLYLSERRLYLPVLVSSIFLFYAGLAFTYFLVLPLLLAFIRAFSIEGVQFLPDIASYLDFCIKLFLAFGIIFEIPVATVLIIQSGLISARELEKKRPWVIVLSLTLGMLLTPPDVLTQILFALPAWLLFESGLWLARLWPVRRRQPQEAVDEDQDCSQGKP